MADGEVRTFLVANVRGYTRFTVERGNQAAAELGARFLALAREGVAAHAGALTDPRPGEAVAVFSSPSDAVRAAVELQARFRREEDPDLPLRVGIGLDVGEALASQGGYVGKAPILAERLCGLAAPGEVLASEGLIRAVGELQVVMYRERGAIVLKGFPEPIRVVEVLAEEAPR